MRQLSHKTVFYLGAAIAAAGIISGCGPAPSNRVQGYAEGEYVYVASPYAGALESVPVQRGAQVKAGDRLFTLASTPEKAARDLAERQLAQARANLEDARKGKRPQELDSLEAQIKQAEASLELADREFARQEKLASVPGGAAQADYDRAHFTAVQERERVAELKANMETARLGSRADQLTAAESGVKALEATLARADWDLSQKHQDAPRDGLIFDTLYRPGEWVAAGRPVVSLLPPENIKVRAFVSETRIGSIHTGDHAQVIVDGVALPSAGTVSFISPQAEYTPPVIYSRESRDKLVFMIELVFDRATAAKLHPGQPVDVQLSF